MSDRVIFSVIVPTYNRKALLQRCVDSVLSQKFSSLEVIVVDDGSTDDTESIARTYSDTRFRYFRRPHGERSRARNFGISQALGRYVCFVDDDDYLLDNHLEIFYKYLQENDFPDHIIRTGYYREVGERRYKTENFDEQKHGHPVKFIAAHMCGVGSLCIPRSFLVEDVFPENYWHFQDTHLFIRLLAKRPFHQINNYSYVYVIHGHMGSRFTEAEFRTRATNNLQAMEDLFSSYQKEIEHLLPFPYCQRLVAEKAIQHSSMAFSKGWLVDGWYFFRKANQSNSSILNLLNIFRRLPGQIIQNIRT